MTLRLVLRRTLTLSGVVYSYERRCGVGRRCSVNKRKMIYER